jgi:hypothetical protein
MALRLLRQKVPLGDRQIIDLKTVMFKLENGLWYSRSMIASQESQLAFEAQAMEWLKDYGCFSVERLFEIFSSVLHHIDTPKSCAVFLRHLGFTEAVWGKDNHFCYFSPPNLNDHLETIAKAIDLRLEESDGVLSIIEMVLPGFPWVAPIRSLPDRGPSRRKRSR